MNRKVFLIILFIFFNLSIFATPSQNEILIKTKDSLQFNRSMIYDEEISSIFSNYKISSIDEVSPSSIGFNWYLITTEEKIEMSSLKNQAKNLNNIKEIQYNGLSQFNLVPNDSLYNDQSLIFEMINAPQVWDIQTGSEQIVVAVVDSGILFLEDLINNIFINEGEIPDDNIDNDGNGFVDDYMGYDFVHSPYMSHIAIGDYLDRDCDVTDETYHGTHVSGIIAADSDNNIGIAGTAWNIKIMPIRAGFSTTGGGGFLEDDDAAAALLYAANMGVHIINVSWGDANYSQIIKDAIDYCAEKGVIVVCAAGNTPGGNINYPARFNNTISVGAVDQYKQLASFSSYGPELDIMAPGQEILSTYSEETIYNRLSGTSMAAPFVSGAIALLLSEEPGLDVFEIKNRLMVSALDLGDQGFDIHYGYGLLDINNLIQMNNDDIVEISYPVDNQKIDSSFNIFGRVNSSNFLRYTVMFTDELHPQSTDWKDVSTHTNTPVYYYNQVENNVLANFYLPSSFNDNLYRLRVRMECIDGNFIDKFLLFYIDREIPSLVEESVFCQKRYNEYKAEYYVFSLWNKKVALSMDYKIGDTVNYVASAVYDSVHILLLDDLTHNGELEVKFSALDLSGNIQETEWIDLNINITQEEIPNTDFISMELGSGLVLSKNNIDFNNNNRKEFIAMQTGESIMNSVCAYEFYQNNLIETHSFLEDFWPLDAMKKDNGYSKIASLRGDQLQIYESLSVNSYPDLPLWNLSDVSGAIFADFNNDTNQDIVVVRNLLSEIAIELYQENSDSYQIYDTILNNTQTNSRRMFVPKIQADNLDNDEYLDLLTADTDGDVMIWEYVDGEAQLSWTKRLPITNIYYLQTGDFTGDGQVEFLAGGYVTSEQANKSWWYFELFKSTQDNQYISIDSIAFSKVITGENSISSIDFTGDGKKEIVLALSPYLYVLSYLENSLKPIFWTNCDNSYQISSMESNEYHNSLIVYNKTIDEELKSFALTINESFNGPNTPQNLNAEVLTDGIKLSWDNMNADYFEIFFKYDEDSGFQYLGQSVENEFYDNRLIEKQQIIYSVRALASNLDPIESYMSYPIIVHLVNPTEVIDVKMVSNDSILLTFNNSLQIDCINMLLFNVNNEVGSPSSVNFFDDGKILYLTFFSDIPEREDLKLSFRGLKDSYNRQITDSVIDFLWNIDTVSPYVTRVQKESESQFSLIFSELLDYQSSLLVSNYSLEVPVEDYENCITEISVIDSIVTCSLLYDIAKVNKNYYIKMKDIRDLSGNVINSMHNRISLNLTELRDLSLLVVYPNPLNINETDRFKFENLPKDKKGDIKIFNMAGEIIFEKKIINEAKLEWQVCNNKGKAVSSGLYYYIISFDGENKRGKLAVIR
ncbi:MAG: S8 family serine peptidase [Candidatus Cloacimonetes bacterium]|nr:S8 family serine peptidase [Candidatus Cloacimonadota bacterium]